MNKNSNAVVKIGIIFGIIILIATVVIFFFANKKGKDSVNVSNEQTEVVVENQEKVSETPVVETPIVETSTQPVEVVKEVEKVVSQITDINEDSLGNPTSQEEVLVRIAKKGVMLLDNSPDTTEDKMLVYYFAVYGPNGEDFNLFMTKAAYDAYNVNDTLLVNYAVYKNNNGIEFPIIHSVKDPNAVQSEANSEPTESTSE